MTPLIQRSAIIITLLTSIGILVHDTKMDQAAITALALPAVLASFDMGKAASRLSNSEHTHVERVSFAQGMHLVGEGMPRNTPRGDHKKYHLTQKVAKGVHAFDGYYQPLGDL